MRTAPKFARRTWFACAFLLGLGILSQPAAYSQSFSVAYSFTGAGSGANPLNGLAIASGNLYGTASSGGPNGAGVVYKINGSTGAQSVVYAFTGGADGGKPESGLLLFAGNLYGTTAAGGTSGAGTVYEVTLAGKETVLYSFTGNADGSGPDATLTKDAAGNLYGTTFYGGTSSNGTVFELVRPKVAGSPWTEKVLYSFSGHADGANPVAGVTFDKGSLYGTASGGGTYGYGTVFELTPATPSWTESTLHEFQLQSDGGVPYAGLILNGGKLYGASTDGGEGGASGGGTIFELTNVSGSWSFNVIDSLAGWGISGSFRNLLMSGGKIYATTHCDGANNAGTIYQLTTSGGVWSYTPLYVFTGGSDGLFSFSNLVLYKGDLWGTTNEGGAYGSGVVFKIKP